MDKKAVDIVNLHRTAVSHVLRHMRDQIDNLEAKYGNG